MLYKMLRGTVVECFEELEAFFLKKIEIVELSEVLNHLYEAIKVLVQTLMLSVGEEIPLSSLMPHIPVFRQYGRIPLWTLPREFLVNDLVLYLLARP